jgi:tRNA A37 methylthiotransferase MiaB
MPDRIPAAVRTERVQRLAAIEGELREAYFRSLIGRNLRVLLEARSCATAGHVVGTSCRYATVELPSGAAVGQLVNAVARELLPGPRLGALPMGGMDRA